MPITGKLVADFASFYDAVNRAEVELRSFETGAGKVETSLNRMVDSLSGRRVIQEAQLMAEAVERIGGAAKLTEKDMARVGATTNEAVKKMEALGIDVPDNLRKIAGETNKVEGAQTQLIGTLRDVAAAFGIAFSIQAVVQFGRHMLSTASDLQDLSNQTRISVEELQVLSSAMSEFGVDSNELGRALFTLSRQIAGGDESIASALAIMGLSFKDVQGLNGEQLFLTIERGLATLQGSLRDTTAAELFGSKLGAAMAGASEGIDATVEAARRLNTVMSQETVASMDRFGETVDRAKVSLTALAANALGPAIEEFNAWFTLIDRGIPKVDLFVAALKDLAEAQWGGSGTSNMTRLIDEHNQALERDTTTTRDATTAQRDHTTATTDGATATTAGTTSIAGYIAALRESLGSTAALTAEQRNGLAALKEMNLLTAEHASKIGVSKTQLAEYTDEVKRTTEAEKQRTKATEDAAKAAAALDTAYAKLMSETANLQGEAWMKADIAAMEQAKAAAEAVQAEYDAWFKSVNEGVLIVGALGDTATAAGDKQVAAAERGRQAYGSLTDAIAAAKAETEALSSLESRFWSSATGGGTMAGTVEASTGLSSNDAVAAWAHGLKGGVASGSLGGALIARPGISGGGPSVVNNFSVNGTGQEVARVVMDEITRSMKNGRKWPTA